MAESEATGEIGEIFADIREAMNIPLVTSIWRILAGIDGALAATWHVAGPVVRSGQVDASAARLHDEVSWPEPARAFSGPAGDDLETIRAIVAAYTRSNMLTLLVLRALVDDPVGEPSNLRVPAAPAAWPELPALLEHDRIDAQTWALVEQVNRIGATPDEPGVATLWRHLAAWPDVLATISAGVAPLQTDGSYGVVLAATQSIVAAEAGRLAYLRPTAAVPAAARARIEPYVTHPGLVQRMVVIGSIVTGWLEEAESNR